MPHANPTRWAGAVGFVTVMLFISVVWMTSANSSAISEYVLQDVPAVMSGGCANAECHSGIINRKVMHGPAARLECEGCHQSVLPEAHLFALAAPATQLCRFCHAPNPESVVHAPVMTSECMKCHDPHGSEYQFQLNDDPAGGLCFRCHPGRLHADMSDDNRTKALSHGCTSCHNPHVSGTRFLLREPPMDDDANDDLPDPPRIEIDRPFPDIVLPAMDDGRPLSVSAFRGEKVVLQVFASW